MSASLKVGDFVHTLGDAHLYLNHLEQTDLQLSRTPKPLPKLVITRAVSAIEDFRYEDFRIEGYEPAACDFRSGGGVRCLVRTSSVPGTTGSITPQTASPLWFAILALVLAFVLEHVSARRGGVFAIAPFMEGWPHGSARHHQGDHPWHVAGGCAHCGGGLLGLPR